MTSDEVNYLIYRYLQENGFLHSAFTFAYESQITKSNLITSNVPSGALIAFMQKGLQYVGIESHVNCDGEEKECGEEVNLLNPHCCKIAQNVMSNHPMGKSRKRKEASESNGLQIQSSDVTVLSGHSEEVFICMWNPRNNLLATSSGDSTARIWNLPHPLQGGSTLKKMEAILPHSNELLTISANQDVKMDTADDHNKEEGSKKDVTTIEWNGDGTLLASGSYDGLARIWNETGQLERILHCHKGPIFALKWNKSGTSLVSASFDKTTVVWDPHSGDIKQQFQVHSAPALDVDWKDTTTFASCSTDTTIQLCTIGQSAPVMTFKGHQDEVNTIKWNPSGTLLASCSDDHTAKIWNPTRSSCVQDFREHDKEIYTIQWTKTGPGTDYPNKNCLFATASFDTTVKLWDVETGKCLHTLSHSDAVYSVSFSPDGDYLASGALNGVLNIWSTTTGQVVKKYYGSGDIYSVDWNKTGDLVAAAFADSNLCVVNFRS